MQITEKYEALIVTAVVYKF